MAIFKGAGVAVVTPMKDNFDVDFEKLEAIVDDQIKNGTDCIIVTGTTGEASTLSEEVHIECIRTAVAAAKKRIPVMAGTGANNTQTAMDLARAAQEAGADALLAVNPYYNKATQKGIQKYYTRIAEASDLPICMYNIPGRTGSYVAPETTAQLAKEVDTVVAMKDATGDIAHTLRLMELTNGDFDIYSGEDGQVIPLLACGGIGVISVLSNLAPKFVHDMVLSFLRGDTEKALEMQLKCLPLVDALFCEVNPIPVKKGMNLMGWNVGPAREPLTEMEEANAQKLEKAMREFGIILA
jgi:4-hydroxy-tetrahydrodipicolinate synthase